MTVHRAIFRLDYQVNYAVIDAPGRLMRMLAGLEQGDFFDSIQDSVKDRTVGANFKSRSSYRLITVSPTNLVFGLEELKGWSAGEPLENERLRVLSEAVNQICEAYKIEDVIRAGFRVWAFESIGGDFANAFSSASRLLSSNLHGAIEATVGGVKDIGFAFDGGADERAKYHVKFGPCTSSEIASKDYLQHQDLKDALAKESEANIVFDVDLYEEGFSFKGRRPSAWLRHQSSMFARLSSAVLQLIKRGE